jgi:glycosidase
MIDVVLNHTANNSPWLEEHPEAGESASFSPADRAYPGVPELASMATTVSGGE